jgi:hypothetical protein
MKLIISSLKENVKYIIVDQMDIINTVKVKIKELNMNDINEIGILREEEYDNYFTLFNEKYIVKDIQKKDPTLQSWISFIEFFIYLKHEYKLKTLNMISCNLYSYPEYIYIFNNLESLISININASDEKIGKNHWVLNKYNVNLLDTFFTYTILYYPYYLGIDFNINLSISGIIPDAKLNISTSPSIQPNINTYWTQVNTISGGLTISGNLNNYYMINNTYGYAIGNNSLTFTYNGGITWTPVNPPANSILRNIYCWDISTILI